MRSRKDFSKIAQRFNAGFRLLKAYRVPAGTVEAGSFCERLGVRLIASFVPERGLDFVEWARGPSVKTLGYFQQTETRYRFLRLPFFFALGS